MTTTRIQVLDPVTGRVVRLCRGPAPSGWCPLAGPDGVVPCAGLLISPAHADPEHWPLPIPAGYRHCDLLWSERAQSLLRKAENSRRRWEAGLTRETDRVRMLANRRDPRYRRMTPRQLRTTALWRWRLSTVAQALRRSEQKSREQAEAYLAFVKFRHSTVGGQQQSLPGRR